MVLVVLFPLPDEKNVDVKTIFTCSQTCLLEMKPTGAEHASRRTRSVLFGRKHRLKCCQNRGIEPTQGRGVRTTPASTRGHMWMGARTRTHELFGAIRSYWDNQDGREIRSSSFCTPQRHAQAAPRRADTNGTPQCGSPSAAQQPNQPHTPGLWVSGTKKQRTW